MTIYPSKKKSALAEFDFLLAPERIEVAYQRVEVYFTEYHHLDFSSSQGVTSVLDELIRQNGEKVRKALKALVCDPQDALYPVAREVLSNGVKPAVTKLVPMLGSRFSFPPAVALQISVLALKAITVGGETAVCEELTQQRRHAAQKERAKGRIKKQTTVPSVPRHKRH
jgi:hypothetical protein